MSSPRGIPAGLQRAIHKALGPGPVGVGTSPLVSGVARSSGGWNALAPHQGISAVISDSGYLDVRLDNAGLDGTLFPRSIGTGQSATPLHVESSAQTGNRLTQFMGPVTTHYFVTSGGLKQEFTISKGPKALHHDLVISLGPGAGWAVEGDGTSLIKRGPKDAVSLDYGALKTTDAGGTVLASHLQIVHDTAQIVVDTPATTAYPIDVDPTWTSTGTPSATLSNSGGMPQEYFGYAVAMSSDGSTAVIGAFGVGAAYIFHTSDEKTWSTSATPTATLTDPVGIAPDQFGSEVAMSADGTTAVIGARGVGPGYPTGAACVFHVSSEDSWVSSANPTAVLTNSGGIPNDYFGQSVAVSADGSTVIIGAPGSIAQAGGAYVFHVSSGESWASSGVPTATLTLSGGAPQDYFGYSVAMSGDGTTAVIGAIGASSATGVAYVFHVASEGSWVTSAIPTATLTNAGDTPSTQFGVFVALSADGSTALIGICNEVIAYVFHVSNEGSWSTTGVPTATLTIPNGPSEDEAGVPVALSADGSTALIGSIAVGSVFWSGAAFVYHVPGEASWTSSADPTATLTDAHSGEYGYFGSSVAVSRDGTTAMIGAATDGRDPGVVDVYRVLSRPSAPLISDLPTTGTFRGGFTATVATTGDGARSVTSSTTSVCTVRGSKVLFDGIGRCDLTAHVAQGADYAAANGGAQSIWVHYPGQGYVLAAADGGVFTFGDAGYFGSEAGKHLGAPVVGIAPTPDGKGYWLVAADGGVFTFGDAGYHGSKVGQRLSAQVVGMAPTPDGDGYWLVAADGGVFTFGDAGYYGSKAGKPLGAAVVGIAPTPDGNGYWLVAADGGVFTFGDAGYYGSKAGKPLGAAVVGIAPTPDGNGYWLVAADGGVFTFGDAGYYGSKGGKPLGAAVVGIAPTPDGNGYWLVAADGGVFTFGDAGYYGSKGGNPLSAPVVGDATVY